MKPDTLSFSQAVTRVWESYKRKGVHNPDHEQILVQPMLTGITMSGVIFTRHQYSDSPYYVINYDDNTFKTDTVTGGSGGKTVFLCRNLELHLMGKWKKLISSVRELEFLFPKFPLDIEFAVDAQGRIIILQCRALLTESFNSSLEESAVEVIEELKLRFDRSASPIPGIPGKTTVLSDMTDWNPAEIIGDKPGSLSYSLYRELVTESTWHQAGRSRDILMWYTVH